jgi:hypothetical protein
VAKSHMRVKAGTHSKDAGSCSGGKPLELKVSLWCSRRAGACGDFLRSKRRLRTLCQGWQRGPCSASGKGALPNPSFKRSPNGMALGPRGSAVYHLPRGPSATPSVPA